MATTTAATPIAARGQLPPWNPAAIGWLSVLFTFLPAGILWALNFARLGQPDKTRPRLIGVALGYLVFWVLAFWDFGDGAVQQFLDAGLKGTHAAVAYAFYHQQKPLFRAHIEAGGKKASIWLPAAFFFLFLLALLAGMFVYFLGPKVIERGPAFMFDSLIASRTLAKGEFNRAAPVLKRLAEAGDPTFQVVLGHAYVKGQGVEHNLVEAMKWYRAAAEQGHAEGQYMLGLGYENGEGVGKNIEAAERWYRKAAQQGDVRAQHGLGLLLYEHTKNAQEAHKWLLAAAEQGHADSQYALSVVYRRGIGVPVDEKKAREWLEKAAAQGHTKAKERLAAPAEPGKV